ncbi:hypothetical protein ABLO27_00645 [Roseibium sp. SCPC15]
MASSPVGHGNARSADKARVFPIPDYSAFAAISEHAEAMDLKTFLTVA